MSTLGFPSINTLMPEAPKTPEVAPAQPTETSTSPLKGEIGAENAPQPAPTASPNPTPQIPIPQQPLTAPSKPKVVDLSAVTTKTHPVATGADALTTIADKEEEEFIQGVESAHNAHK